MSQNPTHAQGLATTKIENKNIKIDKLVIDFTIIVITSGKHTKREIRHDHLCICSLESF